MIHFKDPTKVKVLIRTRISITDHLLRMTSMDRYQRGLNQQDAVIALATHEAVVAGDLGAAFNIITETTARTLGVERTGIWMLTDDGNELHCHDLHDTRSNDHAAGTVLLAKDYPCYFKALLSERTIVAEDARADLQTSEFTESYLVPNNIASMLDSPIRMSGKLVGVVCNEQLGDKRTWQPDEIKFAAEIAGSAPLAVRSIRATLRGDLADRVAAATDHEMAEQERLRRTADFREGTRAMAERRQPKFTGVE